MLHADCELAGELGARTDAELAVDLRQRRLDRTLRDDQDRGDSDGFWRELGVPVSEDDRADTEGQRRHQREQDLFHSTPLSGPFY